MLSHSVNKFSGVTLLHDFEVTTAKVGTIQQNYNVIDEVNLRVKAKGFTHEVMPKKLHHVSSWKIQQKNIMSEILVYIQLMLFFQMMPFLLPY